MYHKLNNRVKRTKEEKKPKEVNSKKKGRNKTKLKLL